MRKFLSFAFLSLSLTASAVPADRVTVGGVGTVRPIRPDIESVCSGEAIPFAVSCETAAEWADSEFAAFVDAAWGDYCRSAGDAYSRAACACVGWDARTGRAAVHPEYN